MNIPDVKLNVFAGKGRSFITDINGNIYASVKNNEGELGINTDDPWVKPFKKLKTSMELVRYFAPTMISQFSNKIRKQYVCGTPNKIGEDGFSNSP